MQPIALTSPSFQQDQQPVWEISYWDTPFATLENDVASGGIQFWLREPTTAGVFDTAALKAATTQATAASAFNALGREIVTNGRLPNLMAYWAGGAPGHHGASWNRRVCYRFNAYLRSATGRAWFDPATLPTWTPCFGGNGYLKIFKVVSGTPTLLFDGALLEQDFLDNGLKFTATITNMAAGDSLDIFYIQDGEAWGGFVVKAVQGTLPSTVAAQQAAARVAPVIGCGLLDDNAPPTKRSVNMFQSGSVDHNIGSSSNASFSLPLLTSVSDNVGWTWIRTGAMDPGVLRSTEPLQTTYDLKRQRLVRIRAGFGALERHTIFTGFVDDWQEPQSGVVPVQCLGFEQRLGDQFNKNYPDKISYMAFNYRARKGASEPVYEVAAYDNWPVEHVIRDLFLRAGIDESKVFKARAIANSTDMDLPIGGVIGGVTIGGIWTNAMLKNMANGSADAGEVDYEGIGTFTHPNGATFSVPAATTTWTPFEAGTVSGREAYLMYTGSDKTRFGAHPGGNDQKEFQAVQFYNGTWWYSDNVSHPFNDSFTPNSNDCIVGKVVSDNAAGIGTLYRYAARPVVYGTDIHRKFRARSLTGTLLRLERAVHYGNTGAAFNELLPSDDPYIFPPENTKELWNRCREVADRYGYDLRFDEFGDAWLQGRNNIQSIKDLTASGTATSGTTTTLTDTSASFTNILIGQTLNLVGGQGSPASSTITAVTATQLTVSPAFSTAPAAGTTYRTGKTNPAAFGGTYGEYTGTVALSTTNVLASRIDISAPKGPALGSWTYTVKRAWDSTTVASGTIVADNSAGTNVDEFFYDFRAVVDGTNSTVITLFSGDFDSYNVELSSTGGSGGTVRRLDCLLLYHTDPAKPLYPPLSTSVNALEVHSRPMMDDMRNHVIVVGRRRAVVTDSDKLNTNPNNPDSEFVVERAVDVGSIVSPTASNYIGYPKESLIFDNGITDQDFAAYIARVFIYRQRIPKPTAAVSHTMLPALQLRDPVFAAEEGFDTIDTQTVLYVTSVSHRFEDKKATTAVQTTSFPEFPAYEPREDVDIDLNFGSNPVINVKVTYASVTGETKTNMPVGTLQVPPYSPSTDADIMSYAAVTKNAGSPPNLDLTGSSFSWPPMPGTVQIRAQAGTLTGTQQTITRTETVHPGGSFGAGPGNRIILANARPAPQTIDSIKVKVVNRPEEYTPSPTKGAAEFHYEFDEITECLYVFYDNEIVLGAFDDNPDFTASRFTIEIKFTPWATGVRGAFAGNNPYHHFVNVDYRNSNRRIYLPWVEGDSSANYQGISATTAFDVRYRRLGPVDGSGNFSDPYTGLSPFYDPYTSEVGNLVNVTFDALVSGLYRISICNRVDDTVVAWLTEPAAEPHDEELHWQYMAAAAGKVLSWDGVDQIGAWNRKQSEDYATGAMGAFEAEERPVIGKGFYVWNEERRAGVLGPLALIAGSRDTMGVPIFGVGTFSTWYIKFEVKNDAIEAISETNKVAGGVRDPKKESPRVVNTSRLDPTYNTAAIRDSGTSTGSNTSTTLNDTGKAWIVNQWKGYQVKITSGLGSGQTRTIVSNTATQLTISSTEPWSTTPTTSGYQVQSTAAVVYSHLPEPTKVELTVSDWKPPLLAPVFDETNQTAIDTTANWQTGPGETGTSTGSNTGTTLNDTGKSWTTDMWKGREVKITNGSAGTIGQIRRVVSNTATQLTITPSWTNTPTTQTYRILSGALVNNQKPVRVRFTVMPRPGTLWSGKQNEVSVKLTRRVHLKASIFDQFVVYSGVNYPGQTREKRTVKNRLLMNDSHTIDFADSGYRKAASFKQTDGGAGLEWLFLPRHFAKDFRGIPNEALQFGDYLQLEEVPSWDPNRSLASERSRITIAFMNYLFYLSAFTQDRSGRLIWCLNRTFLDKTKIIKNDHNQWWDPGSTATPPAAASSSTYRNTWPESYLRQHRRSMIVRQWADESGWQAGQRTKHGFSVGGTADLLLRHMWKDHEVANPQFSPALLVTAAWPALDTDDHSKWHRDSSRTMLPSGYFNLTRQLGAAGTTRLTGTAAPWTWEGTSDNTEWIPCISRDFHGYHFVPPMVDKNNDEGALASKSNIYRSVDPNAYRSDDNTGDDVAAAEVWNSPVWDMNQSYDSGNGGKKRFNPGIVVDPGKGPTANPLDANVFDYMRQDDLVHYEELRGMYSRGARPQEQPKKISPVMPYYVNQYEYTSIDTFRAYKNDKYPKFKSLVHSWFAMKFRYEYLWESGELFPTDDVGRELLGFLNYDLLRSKSLPSAADLRFDGGAWTGWKDDKITTDVGDTNYKLHTNATNVFQPSSGIPATMPMAVGPQLDITVDMIFHMILINQRRAAPLTNIVITAQESDPKPPRPRFQWPPPDRPNIQPPVE